MQEMSPKRDPFRVICFVDGFNLYFGLKDSGMRRFLWLDLPKLASLLITENQTLVRTNYYTALVSAPEDKRIRQATYLEALQLHSNDAVTTVYGQYKTRSQRCSACQYTQLVPGEKKTDVNIAVDMMVAAFGDEFDTALLISADSDLVPPIMAIRRLFPGKRIVVAFPPGRYSRDLEVAAHASFTIGRAKFSHSQLPETVLKPNGVMLSRPSKWAGLIGSQGN